MLVWTYQPDLLGIFHQPNYEDHLILLKPNYCDHHLNTLFHQWKGHVTAAVKDGIKTFDPKKKNVYKLILVVMV